MIQKELIPELQRNSGHPAGEVLVHIEGHQDVYEIVDIRPSIGFPAHTLIRVRPKQEEGKGT
jgi:hypothetical protein